MAYVARLFYLLRMGGFIVTIRNIRSVTWNNAGFAPKLRRFFSPRSDASKVPNQDTEMAKRALFSNGMVF